jgi:hypothetical protein
VSHFEKKDDFIHVTEKELMLNKMDFVKKKNEVDEDQFPRHSEKAVFSSRRGKQNINVVMLDDDSDEDSEVEGDVVALGNDVLNFKAGMEEGSDDKEFGRMYRRCLILLVGVQLRGVAISDEDG